MGMKMVHSLWRPDQNPETKDKKITKNLCIVYFDWREVPWEDNEDDQHVPCDPD